MEKNENLTNKNDILFKNKNPRFLIFNNKCLGF